MSVYLSDLEAKKRKNWRAKRKEDILASIKEILRKEDCQCPCVCILKKCMLQIIDILEEDSFG